jgi:hypothetical protein
MRTLAPITMSPFSAMAFAAALTSATSMFVSSAKITEIRDLGTEVEVSDGVKKGDQVVLSPPVDLEEGGKVQVRATATAKAS